MMNDNRVHAHECSSLVWKPIIAGALIAVGLSFLLNLFSVAIGLTAFTTSKDGIETLAMGGLVGTAVGTIVAMFAAGWVTGYFAKNYCPKREIGAYYGFLTWCVALILAVILASHLQQYVSFYGHFISGTTESLQIAHTGASANTPVNVTATNVDSNKLVLSAYIVFGLFFLGAFSSALGGHCGMRHKCKNDM